jgi:hypothetical protein
MFLGATAKIPKLANCYETKVSIQIALGRKAISVDSSRIQELESLGFEWVKPQHKVLKQEMHDLTNNIDGSSSDSSCEAEPLL